jgi:hypothetical protein
VCHKSGIIKLYTDRKTKIMLPLHLAQCLSQATSVVIVNDNARAPADSQNSRRFRKSKLRSSGGRNFDRWGSEEAGSVCSCSSSVIEEEHPLSPSPPSPKNMVLLINYSASPRPTPTIGSNLQKPIRRTSVSSLLKDESPMKKKPTRRKSLDFGLLAELCAVALQ